MSNITFVTTFIILPKKDLQRPHDLNFYKEKSSFTLSLDVNLVIFIDEFLEDFVREKRKDKLDKTVIIPTSFHELYFVNKYQNYETEILPHDTPSKDTKEYKLLVANKLRFIKIAQRLNTFNSDFYAWIDFGLGYVPGVVGNEHIIQNLNFESNKNTIKIVEMHHLIDEFSKNPQNLARVSCSVWMCGGFWITPANKVDFLIDEYEKILESLIKERIIFTEEIIFSIISYHYPEHFDFYFGTYYTIISCFNKKNCDSNIILDNLRMSDNNKNWKHCIKILEYIQGMDQQFLTNDEIELMKLEYFKLLRE